MIQMLVISKQKLTELKGQLNTLQRKIAIQA